MEHDGDLSSADEGGAGASSSSLEARVARLEAQLAMLQRQAASTANVRSAVPSSVAHPNSAAWSAPPPPPPPLMTQPVAASVSVPPLDSWKAPADPRASFENRLGSQIFNRIGIVLLLIGTAWFLKYAVDREWIGPAGRVIAGLMAGAGIVVWSERFRAKGFAAFSYSLKALGSGVLYLSLWAAFQLYHLLPAPVALGLMVLVTAWNAYMAWVQNSELLAAYALVGGFLTPMLLSTGGNHETFLFSYLLALDIAIVALVRIKTWPRLLLGAWPLTMVFFIVWYAQYFRAEDLLLTSVFIVLFDCTFSSVPVRRGLADANMTLMPRVMLIEDIAQPLCNAAFLSLGLYSVLQDSGHHALLPWLMIVLAAVYLGFMRLPQSRTSSAIHLSIAVVFLTIAIPLKASGQWITVGWLVEGLALLWVASRLISEGEEAELYASRTLRWLGSAALVLGFSGIVSHVVWSGLSSGMVFLNADTGTALTGIIVFAGAAWLALRTCGDASWVSVARAAVVAIDLTALLLTLRELAAAGSVALHRPFQSAEFYTALIGLVVFAGVIGISLRLMRQQADAAFWSNCAGLSTIAFNLIAVLTGVREISAIWDLSLPATTANLDAALQQALAISGFLMVYGAALLAVGFWRRTAFLRWQGLALLVFTIFKTFLYDMRNLSQGYRVVSFMALGALLMAVSFAYQKDWLGLREPEASAEEPGEVRP